MFPSFFAGGFECSTHIRRSGRRLDLVAATVHDKFAMPDYLRLRQMNLRVAREGVRWHLVEKNPGHYNFSSVLPIVRAARATGTQVVWDLCHFGWPDHLDVFEPRFVTSLARYGAAFAKWLANETAGPNFFVPINEISYFSWAAGDEGSMFPFATGRGTELKAQLVRAAVEAIEAIWAEAPDARFMLVDPAIHVVAHPRHPEERSAAEAYRLSQFQAWDMLSGRMNPELGGKEKYLDIVGANFYGHNQWFYNLDGVQQIREFRTLNRRNPEYRPFRAILREVYERYRRPVFIAETGAEDRVRASWFRYVVQECIAAMRHDVPIQGICLYPILNHPGWLDDRHCHNGLWDYPDRRGNRLIYAPLARELLRAQLEVESLRQSKAARGQNSGQDKTRPSRMRAGCELIP